MWRWGNRKSTHSNHPSTVSHTSYSKPWVTWQAHLPGGSVLLDCKLFQISLLYLINNEEQSVKCIWVGEDKSTCRCNFSSSGAAGTPGEFTLLCHWCLPWWRMLRNAGKMSFRNILRVIWEGLKHWLLLLLEG